MRRPMFWAVATLATLVGLYAPAAGAEDVSAKLSSAKQRANAVAARLAGAESRLAVVQDQLARLTAQAADAQRRMGQARGRVREMALREYVTGHSPDLTGRDFNSVARGKALLGLAVSGSRDDLERYRVAKADLDESQANLAGKLAGQRRALAELRAQRAAAQAELAKLVKTQQELAARAARASRAARAAPSRSAVSGVIAAGTWICPVQGPHAFSNDYGQPRPGGRHHQGNDILAPRGTPIVANVAGTMRPHTSSLGGLSYYLTGADGNSYYGAHLEGYAATGNVSAGTVIGYVGNSGDARGGPTHLHFEIHPGGGAPINPYPTLVRYC